MGGLLAMMVAADWPDRVNALVLVDSSHPPTMGMRLDPEVTALFALYLIPWAGDALTRRRVRRLEAESVVRETLRLCCAAPETLDADLVAAHVALERERRLMPWAHQAFFASAQSILRLLLVPGRLRRIAGRVGVPVLVIHGDRDRLASVATARAAARRHRWDLEVFAGIGHVPQIEAPERFVRVVESWLAHAVPH
jgi:pimeloyl-ACP methyl ester carboxylesterase